MTGWSNNFEKDIYYKNYPVMTEEFAKLLAKLEVSIVAMDTPSPDYPPFDIHKILMKKEILIVENLTNLEELIPHRHFNIIALPTKYDAEAAPVRVIAEIKSTT